MMERYIPYKKIFPEMSVVKTQQKVYDLYSRYKRQFKQSDIIEKIADELNLSKNEVLLILQQTE